MYQLVRYRSYPNLTFYEDTKMQAIRLLTNSIVRKTTENYIWWWNEPVVSRVSQRSFLFSDVGDYTASTKSMIA